MSALALASALAAQIGPGQLAEFRQVAPGVALRRGAATDPAGRPQFVNVLTLDTRQPLRFAFATAGTLDETSDLARRAGALAAINAGFFTKDRKPDGAFRIGGADLGIPTPGRPAAIVLTDPRHPILHVDASGAFAGLDDVLAVSPVLLRNGEFPPAGTWNDARHPRSAIGTTPQGTVLWITVDGRDPQAAGMTFAELAATMRSLGCRDAINLDGGGSTTLWLRGAPGNGVVNHPCDDKRFDAAGERAVVNALLVHAEPLRREPAVTADDVQQRTARDFRLTRADLFAGLQRRVRDASAADLDRWDAQGLFDWRELDGQRRYHTSAVSNLFFRDAQARARRLHGSTWIEPSFDTAPRTFTLRLTLTVAADTVPAGETVRAWLPFPQRDDWQEPTGDGTVPDAAMRATCHTAVAQAGRPTVFTSEFTFLRLGVTTGDLDPELARRPHDHAFTAEQPPHVVFSPAVRALARELAGDETNPLRLARRFYDWCADHLTYSFAREYSTIADIPGEVLATRRCDCGQATLLFMTLCRLHGIPARWQSGWSLLPGHENLHDWCAIRLEPWGWIPVDVNAAIELRHADHLPAAERQRQRAFWFGNLDSFRFVANRDHGRDLVPPKRSPRADDVDFQRGEAEWGTPARTLYWDALDLELQVVGRD